jgi:hypothetical protein
MATATKATGAEPQDNLSARRAPGISSCSQMTALSEAREGDTSLADVAWVQRKASQPGYPWLVLGRTLLSLSGACRPLRPFNFAEGKGAYQR